MLRWGRDMAPGEVTAAAGVWLLVFFFLETSIGQVVAQRRQGTVTVPIEIVGDVLSFMVAGCYLRLEHLISRERRDRWMPALLWTLVLGSLMILILTMAWIMMIPAMAAVLLVTSGPQRLLSVAALWGVDGVLVVVRGDGTPPVNLASIVVLVLIGGFGLFVLSRLRVLLHELRRSREAMTRARVDEDRLRISRELHDLLGRTLVAVSLRNEAALRLINTDAALCREQLTAIQSLVIDGQARLRALTSGPVLISLADELGSARELFDLLAVRADIDAVDVGDPVIDQTLAAVVREAVTNILRHGQPTWCRISVGHESTDVVATVVNDGVVRTDDGGVHTGLADIRARVAALGGVLVADKVPDGQFRVDVRIPCRAQVPR